MPDRRQNTPEQYYLDRIATLESQVSDLSIDLAYGCLTRVGLQLALSAVDCTDMYVCYFDLDKFKELNTLLGKARVNQIMSECIQPRHYDMIGLVGRWFSGDELAGVFSRDDVLGYCNRVQSSLRLHGTSGTFLILPALYRGSSIATIDYAELMVSAIKAKGHRNLIAQIGVS